MTVEDLREESKKLKQSIEASIGAFIKNTGIMPTVNIEAIKIETSAGVHEYTKVSVSVDINKIVS